jgi:hypothetical protein
VAALQAPAILAAQQLITALEQLPEIIIAAALLHPMTAIKMTPTAAGALFLLPTLMRYAMIGVAAAEDARTQLVTGHETLGHATPYIKAPLEAAQQLVVQQ